MNTQTQEALKMAIEAMQITDEAFTEFSKGLVGLGIPASILKLDKQSRLIPAIQACKEALAQPAQEPIGYYYPDERMACLLFKKGLEIPRDALPLYGSPAPSWQGLSDAEILDRAAQIMVERHYKEKNTC